MSERHLRVGAQRVADAGEPATPVLAPLGHQAAHRQDLAAPVQPLGQVSTDHLGDVVETKRRNEQPVANVRLGQMDDRQATIEQAIGQPLAQVGADQRI